MNYFIYKKFQNWAGQQKWLTWIGSLKTVEFSTHGIGNELLVQNLTCTAFARVNGFAF